MNLMARRYAFRSAAHHVDYQASPGGRQPPRVCFDRYAAKEADRRLRWYPVVDVGGEQLLAGSTLCAILILQPMDTSKLMV